MITRILDNYFKEKYKEEIKTLLLIYNLDIKFEEDKDEVKLYAKPKKYKNYTYIYNWCKRNSFKEYTMFQQDNFYFDEDEKPKLLIPSIAQQLKEIIHHLNKNNEWN